MTTNTLSQAKVTVRRSEERGHADRGWLKSYHTFSFADYFDADHMGFRSLRVINDDYVAAGGGFPTHPHRDMEILTYVISGQLAHQDSMGNGRTIQAGEVQAMTAGRGVAHSEYNPSASEEVHLLQIWIIPNERGLTPQYSEWKPQPGRASEGLTLLASQDGAGGVTIHQDAQLYLGELPEGGALTHHTSSERGLWLQVIEGEVEAGEQTLGAGDAIAVEEATALEVRASGKARFLLFDLA